MSEVPGIQVTFLDQTGAKSIKAKISPTVKVAAIIPTIITKMTLPVTSPDGQPMSYSLDHKEGGKRLQETQTLPEAGVKEGDHLIVYPEIVAGIGDTGLSSATIRKEVKAELELVLQAVEQQPVFALSLLVNATGKLAEHVKTLGGSVVGIDWPTAQGFKIVKVSEV